MQNRLSLHDLAIVSCLFTVFIGCSPRMVVESPVTTSESHFEGKKEKNPILLNEINSKVLRSFYMSFGEVSDVNWFRSANGFAAGFKLHQKSYTVYYKMTGVEESRVMSYFEEQLVPPVRHVVRTAFYDDRILHITEVQKNAVNAYYVKIENLKKIRVLKIIDYEWELVEEVIKR